MKCLIVDDEKIFRMVIKRLLELDSTLSLVAECESAIEAHQKILDEKIDLIFLDISMPGMDGLELAKILKKGYPMVVFMTSNKEHAVEAFDLNAVDYLLKPVSEARFLNAIEKAKDIFKTKSLVLDNRTSEFVFIRDSNTVRKLSLQDILYFEATGDYVKVSLKDKHYIIHSSLKTIEQKLPSNVFLRVHRSFIINLNNVDSSEGKTLIIKHHMIPVSSAYRSELNKHMLFL
ncbi:LytR/AlgR family response regulator transcription factor [Pedobacter endophyticus]|uniref:Response regulator transcription factor n=1 Tax=Pedobacter endophyticus TaxID=2789740 RepID=A0A7U3Q5U3_9SPHI|nr:LytTR family DNA-binding domain-containing protein [Pedobacter endophyticus]QPH38864.1 response regulator transcription factor [Pedobacter endophyticus]